MRFFAELVSAGVIGDASAVNRVVIDARRGERMVVIHVELVADLGALKAIRESPLLDGLDLVVDEEEP
jgi:hypothetical protein